MLKKKAPAAEIHYNTGSDWPRVTVVTPSFNQGEYLEETILSILDQGYPNLEYIVIDGGSTDSSVDIIRKYSDSIDYWVSEPDKGQTHALVKGLDRASGEWFNWINSDDLLEPGALHAIAQAANGHDVVAGNTLNFGLSQEKLIKSKALSAWGLLTRPLGSRTKWHQPSLWLKTRNIKLVGGLDPSLQYRFDFDLLVRYLKTFPDVVYLDKTLARFRLHDDSKTVNETGGAFRKEAHRVLEKIAASDEFQNWGPELIQLQAAYQWQDYLYHSLRRTHTGRLARAGKMLFQTIKNPRQRFSRKSLTYLYRVLTTGGPKKKGY